MSLEAQESSLSFDLLTWIEENKKLLKLTISGTIIAVTAIIIVRWHAAKTEAEASYAVVAAGTVSPTSTNAVSAETWLALATKHSGTRAAERALLLGATQLYTEGKYAEAAAKFDAFIAEAPDHPFASTALLGKAAALDAQNKLPEAATAYQTVIARFPSDPAAGQARLGKARVLEASGQFEQALALCDELARSSALSSAAREAASLREAILAKHPELSRPQSVTNSINVVPSPVAK